MIPPQATDQVKHFLAIAIDGAGVALFAWLFDISRRTMFGGYGVVFKALFHGWSTFSLALTRLDAENTSETISKPSKSLAKLIFGSTLVLFSVSVLNFVITAITRPAGITSNSLQPSHGFHSEYLVRVITIFAAIL